MPELLGRFEHNVARRTGDRRNTRYRRGHCQGAQGCRLQGRRQHVGNDEAAAKFKAKSGIPVYKWDVSSFEACATGVNQIEADLGPIEVLVNNAGITRDAQLHRMKPEEWTAVINTDLGSLFNMTRQVIDGIRERKFGRIINISSINGQKGQFGQTNYSAAKAGEKSILPTIPIGRLGEPEEIDRCVVFLASDEAGLIAGSTLTANGGQYIT
jgi:acetoacetyl-CoA reductase